MEENTLYRTNSNNFDTFVKKNINNNQWKLVNKNTFFNEKQNIIVKKDNRVKGTAFLQSKK
ncbi:hypothetical protein LT335_00373 [Spiroplasma sp. JKS002669]|uniref:hypothetical protein n=1 Tax=Spiroplasma attinicola TaxID=2904537 RepID=UPI002023169B|nr:MULTISPECIES: hypothetical protein [unclassified Spiroplasma]MCL6428825.1 hypothetical protein [Spiroplasma sp. JKS002669]MCL8210183.1 hypothetical protein [Spiroplasma sp. JKS002670]MCL8210690.1 hypothetical protein [Spiroplasma sp. JKS002671]